MSSFFTTVFRTTSPAPLANSCARSLRDRYPTKAAHELPSETDRLTSQARTRGWGRDGSRRNGLTEEHIEDRWGETEQLTHGFQIRPLARGDHSIGESQSNEVGEVGAVSLHNRGSWQAPSRRRRERSSAFGPETRRSSMLDPAAPGTRRCRHPEPLSPSSPRPGGTGTLSRSCVRLPRGRVSTLDPLV